MTNRATALFLCWLAMLVPGVAAGQDAPGGRLVVTVADPSGAVIPKATVTLAGQDEVTRRATREPALTSDVGDVAFEGLAPGVYTIRAEFAGFEIVEIREYRVRSGENRRTVTLPIAQVAEDLTVARDPRTAGLDREGPAFSTILTREQIEALPDDPEEMEAVLRAMAPPGASFRVDGFSGGRLPPKSQIRSIRLPRMDSFAAQNHGGMNGAMHIDILTQPGDGPVRGSIDVAFRDDALNARNPFAPVKGDESLKQGGLTLSGSIVPNRSGFSLSTQYGSIANSGTLLAAVPGETRAEPVRQPVERTFLTGRVDQALGTDHMLSVSFQRAATDSRNLGVGSYDLPERAYGTTVAENILRMSENGPVGGSAFWESRLQLRWASNDSTPVVEAPTYRVLDAFTSGGAQRTGGSRAFEIEAATDLDYVRGPHAYRVGLLLEGGRYRSDAFSNYLGTFTFASLADFESGRPLSFTQRIGDPLVRYGNLQFGLYAQDDYRVARSVMLSYGLRYELQSLSRDRNNVSPRASVSWSPFAGGATTLRGSVGYFPDWIGTELYEQTLRVDGVRQQELNVIDPAFPDPGAGLTPPTNRYLFDDGVSLPDSFAVSTGVDQQIGPLRLSTTYTYRRGLNLYRGRNLNAPVGGLRPDPTFGNVVEVMADAQSRSHSLMVHGNLVLLEARQTFLAAAYVLTSAETNTSGPFALPAIGDDLAGEWGPAAARHRAGGMFSTNPFGGLGVSVTFRATAGSPYTITTGTDANGDGVFNDRPDGVGRNTALTTAEWDVGLRLSYAFGFGGPRQAGGSGGVAVVIRSGADGGMPGGGLSRRGEDRYRAELYLAAQNATNHPNYIGYSGVLTSPFFGQATNVRNPRKLELGVRFGF